MRQSLRCLIALGVALQVGPAAIAETPDPAEACLTPIAQASQRYHLPDGLLLAVGLVESGRLDARSGHIAPWPWAVQTQGAGHLFDHLDEAIAQTQAGLAAGNGLIDVGCMQVDLFHHPHAFQTLAAAFDPETNVDYAAQLLQKLAKSEGSWPAAIAAYHAGHAGDGAPYLAHVLALWTGRRAGLRPLDQHQPIDITVAPDPLELAAAFFSQGDKAAALALYQAVLRDHPSSLPALLGAGIVAQADGQTRLATAFFEQALATHPDDRLAVDGLLRMIAILPNPGQRESSLLTLRRLAPDSAEIPARLALLVAEQGNGAEAARWMGEAVRLAPDNPHYWLNEALLLDRAGDRRGAALGYERLLASNDPTLWTSLGVSPQSIRARYEFLLRTVPAAVAIVPPAQP